MTATEAGSEERAVLERARYLERTTDLDRPVAEALAWRERGYATAVIGREIDATDSTVQAYLGRVVAQYGLAAVATKPEGERGDLVELTIEDVEELGTARDTYGGPSEREQWLEYAQNHPEHVPDGVGAHLDDLVGSGGDGGV